MNWRRDGAKSGGIYPIGRLTYGQNNEKTFYEFRYVQGAKIAQREGFERLLAFPEIYRAYRSPELFPFFKNR